MLVDLSGLAGFDAVDDEADGGAMLGAGLTLAAIANDATIAARWPALAEAAQAAAAPGHRSAATLGGNLCQDTRCVFYNQSEWWRASNDYCLKRGGDTCHVAPTGQALPCRVQRRPGAGAAGTGRAGRAAIARGERWLPLAQLYRDDGAAHLTLEPGELLSRVRVPRRGREPRAATARRGFAARSTSRWPPSRWHWRWRAGASRRWRSPCRAPTPTRCCWRAPHELAGLPVDDALVARVGKLVAQQVSPMRSTATPSNYRRQVATALVQRLLREMAVG